jgi:hypothetical protein
MSATKETTGQATSAATVTRMLRVMFPHAAFPDGPYERAAASYLESAEGNVRLRTQTEQGLRDLDALAGGRFAGADDATAFELLGKISGSHLFTTLRAHAVVALYDDHEVWELLGYEGPSFDKGGYADRGFADLDWLPDPRIEEVE